MRVKESAREETERRSADTGVATCRRRRPALAVAPVDRRLERIEKRTLAYQHHRGCVIPIIPVGPVHFGKGFALAAPWRPFHLELVAHDRVGLDDLFKRESLDDLAAGLSDGHEWPRHAIKCDTQLFLGLSLRGVCRVFIRLDQTFRDLPDARVLVAIEGAAGVDEQDFGPSTVASKQEDASAPRGHRFRPAGLVGRDGVQDGPRQSCTRR